jgi:hypothetical protein
MTPERIAELRALAESAVPGPWEVGEDSSWDDVVSRGGFIAYGARSNAPFIAAARTALPEALKEIEILRLAMKNAAREIRRRYQDLSPVSAGDAHDRWLSDADGNEIADELLAALEGKP